MADISKITLPSGSEYNIKDAVAREELATKGTYSKPADGIPFEDLADDAKMVILSYGNSTWAQFLEAYRENRVIYCRASSNSNPASGSQTRMAFLAYVNNQANPTEVEFQYYRSVSSHTNSQQGDQVFVYKLNSSGTWTVTTRNAFTKIVAGTGLNSSYSNTTLTITNPNVYESKTAAENGTELSLVTTGEKYAWNHASGSGGDADTVNGHTVNSDVPANAVFTDTTYSSLTAEEDGEDVSLVTTGEKYIWDHIADSVDAATVNGHTVASDVPANAVFTDTHRPIQVDGAQILGSNTTALNLVAGQNITLTNNSGAVTIDATGGSSGGGTNPNLLNNWWFGEGLFHPTGESSITATVGSGGFNIFGDAWHLRCGTVTKVTEGSGDDQITYWRILLQAVQSSWQQTSAQPGQFLQFLQNPLLPYPHGPYTLSVLCTVLNTPCSFGLFVDDQFYNGITIYPSNALNDLYTYTFDMLPSLNSHTLAVGFQTTSQTQIMLFAMKLEVGSVSTLATQNQYGEWAIAESPINKLSSYGGIIEKRLRIQTTSTDSLGKNVLTLQNLNTTRSIAAPNGTSPLRIGFYDQYTDPYGFIGVSSPSNTESGLHINACSPSGTVNSLELTADSSGSRKVTVSDVAAWRKALGIGDSNGAFPLSIAQGGTGATTQNFVDLTTAQTVAGAKTFSDILTTNNAISVKRSSGNAIVIDDQTADSSTNPASAANYTPLAFRDKNGVAFGVIRARHTTSGYKGLYIYGNNSSAPSGKQTTALYMMVNDSGTKLVSLTDPDAWRDALELGTNGAFPLTIAQGGTGSTTKNFVDLSTAQSIAGYKSFTDYVTIDKSAITLSANAVQPILVFKYKNPQGYVKTVNVVRTYGDTEASTNNGCAIIGSNSGTTVICSGESAGEVIKTQDISNTENLYLVSDGGINLWTAGNQSTGAVTKAVTIASSGAVTLSSALPIGSGGTGQTAVTTVTALSSIATAGTNITLTSSTAYSYWGKVAMLELYFTPSAAIAASSTVATLVSGKRPVRGIRGLASNGNQFNINTGGAVTTASTLASGTTYAFRATYLIA